MSLWQLRQFGSRAFAQDLQRAEEAFKACVEDSAGLKAPPLSSRFSPPESLASFSVTPGRHEASHRGDDDECSSCSLGEAQGEPATEPLGSLSEGETASSGTGRRPRATD